MTCTINRLMGPHEWGYRDPTDGGFIADDAPFAAGAEIARLRGALTAATMAMISHRDCPDDEAFQDAIDEAAIASADEIDR